MARPLSLIKQHKIFILLVTIFAIYSGLYSYNHFKWGPDGKTYHNLATYAAEQPIGTCGTYGYSYYTPFWIEFIGGIYSVTGPIPRVISLFSILFAILQAFILYFAARRLWGRAASYVSSLGFLATDQVFKSVATLQYEVFAGLMISIVGILTFMTLYSKKRSIVLSIVLGICISIMLLTSGKTIIIAFFALASIGLAWIRDVRNVQLLIPAIVVVTLMSMWTQRNWNCFGERIWLTTNGGICFFIGNNPKTIIDHYSDPYKVYTHVTPKTYKHHDQKKWYLLGWKYIKLYPKGFVKRFFTRAQLFFQSYFFEQILIRWAALTGLFLIFINLLFLKSFILRFSIITIFSLTLVYSIYLFEPRYVLLSWPSLCLIGSGITARWKLRDGPGSK